MMGKTDPPSADWKYKNTFEHFQINWQKHCTIQKNYFAKQIHLKTILKRHGSYFKQYYVVNIDSENISDDFGPDLHSPSIASLFNQFFCFAGANQTLVIFVYFRLICFSLFSFKIWRLRRHNIRQLLDCLYSYLNLCYKLVYFVLCLK